MGLTITEKIFSSAVEKEVHAGEMITSKIDYSLVNDITGPLAVMEFEKIAKKVWDANKVVIVLDHFTPNKDIKSAGNSKLLREFARKQGIKYFFEGGNVGIEHELLPEKGIARPGLVIVGADSHTCTYGGLGAFSTGIGSTETAAVWATGELWFRVPETFRFKVHGTLRKWVTGKDVILKIIGEIGVDGALYKAMEFAGDAVKEMTLAQRLTMCNMAVEAGAKSGIVEPDYKTLLYVKQHSSLPYKIFKSDLDAVYEKEFEFDGRAIEPMVAAPHLPSNVKPASSFSDVEVNQVVIGSCTNGRYEDLEVAAEILKGRRIAGGVRLIVIPATPSIFKQAMTEGLLKIFMDAGGIISPPTCGPCLGGHMGVLAEGETCIATTNRNFVGRMGHSRSKVYLASPATAAASAVKGKITDPRNL